MANTTRKQLYLDREGGADCEDLMGAIAVRAHLQQGARAGSVGIADDGNGAVRRQGIAQANQLLGEAERVAG